MDKTELKRRVESTIRSLGFNKKGSVWLWRGTGVTAIVSLQKSDHGDYFYLNFGLDIDELSGGVSPRANTCHVQFGPNYLSDGFGSITAKALDPWEAGDEDVTSLIELLTKSVLPDLCALADLKKLRQRFGADGLKGAMVLWQAREFLEQ